MATRNLARTVIEAGRTPSSKLGRKRLRRMERHAARRYCYNAARLIELEELPSQPHIMPRDDEFQQADKLGAAMRWMQSRCGHPWDDTFSDLSIKFRGRGIALSHVVDEHMLDWVDMGIIYRYTRYEFRIEDGCLQENKQTKHPHSPYSHYHTTSLKALAWASERKINRYGLVMYWVIKKIRRTLEGWTYYSYPQANRLTSEEITYFLALPKRIQKELTHHGSNL